MTDPKDRKRGTAIVTGQTAAGATLPTVARIEALMESSRQALAQARTHVDRLRERGRWDGVLSLAKTIFRDDVAVLAAEMVCAAEHAICIADQESPLAKRGRGNKAERDGIKSQLLRTIRHHYQGVDTRLFNRFAQEAREAREPLSRKSVRRKVLAEGRDARNGPPSERASKVNYYSGETGYITPRYILGAARRTMGGIDLDPASFAKANEFVEAERYFTERDDGLKQPWGGRVWLNPPYTRAILGAFVDRLIEHLDSRLVTQALLLVNNSTDADFFHRALNHATAFCLLAGRVRFHLADGSRTHGSPIQGQVILYFSAEIDDALDRFTAEFSPHGRCCYPVWPDVA